MIKQKGEKQNKSADYDNFINSDAFTEIDLGVSPPAERTARANQVARSVSAPEKSSNHTKKENTKKDKNANFYLLISAVICTFIILFSAVLGLLIKDKEYSENENRYLAQKPKISFSTIADGSYMKDTESYLSDQFAGRGALVKTRTAIDIFAGKKEINGIYIGKKHYLFQKNAVYDENIVKANTNSINSLIKKYPKINHYAAIAPDASEILSKYLPNNVVCPSEEKEIKDIYSLLDKNIKTIDLIKPLKQYETPENLFYKTDHHWTTSAAKLAFTSITAAMNTDISKTEYQTLPVTNKFKGTLASSSGLFNAKDTIYITYPETDVKYYVKYVDEDKISASVFDYPKLNSKNQYEVFFGGNFAQVNIETSLNSDKVLLIVKDSYANCLTPMLIPYYKSIIMVDPRYFKGDIDDVIKQEGVSDILWLYNINTFLADTSIPQTFLDE